MSNRTFILKQNSKEIRKKITDAGIHVCICATFRGSLYLSYSELINNGVHGVGYSIYNNLSIEDTLTFFEKEVKNPVYCNNVDEFIDRIKSIM